MRKFKCIKGYKSGTWLTEGKTYYQKDDGSFKYDDGFVSNHWNISNKIVGKETELFNYLVEIKDEKEEIKMNKFKVGDRVRILDGSGIKKYTGGWVSSMNLNIGKIAKISSIEKRKGMPCYQLGDFNYAKLTRDCVYDERGLELIEGTSKPKAITITTSDTTTTITDGTHTTSINRYYTDKHDERNAINIVIDKYYDELTVSKLPKVGDKVRIIDRGQTHSTYDEWLIKNNVDLKSAIKWRNGLSPKNGGEYTIKEIHKHEYFDADLALIEDAENAYIMNIKGLEVIK